ncbi:MAG: transketolase C-terminal domain-containing protein [Candidatus Fermentibacteraceae bacterium]
MLSKNLRPSREGYIQGLLEAGEIDSRVVVIDGDVGRSLGTQAFCERFPTRYFNLGIAEQNMACHAAGLSLEGFVPFYATYAVFAVGRALDQIRTTICNMGLAVRIGGAHSGSSVGPDGGTHQALEDIAQTRSLPGMTVLVPADAAQTRQAVLASLNIPGPVYIRFGRNPVPQVYGALQPVLSGKGNLLHEGRDIVIVACGAMVAPALEAREVLLEKGVGAAVIDMVSVKPLDETLLMETTGSVAGVVTVEDHQATGGLGGAVAEFLAVNRPLPMRILGVPNRFGESGTPGELMGLHGLSTGGIVSAAIDLARSRE